MHRQTLTVAQGLRLTVNSTASTFPELDAGQQFSLTAAASGGSAPYNYFWSGIGSGGVRGPVLTWTYTGSGSYLLQLEVTDSLGGTGYSNWAVLVNPSPSISLAASATLVDVNHSVTLTSTSQGGTGTGPTTWTLGDGTQATGSTVTHSWTRTGTYVVNATYRDGVGLVGQASISITVNSALTGSFTATTSSGSGPVPGTSVTFGASITGGTPPYAVVWAYGDGSMASGCPTAHSFASAGSYRVNVTVTDLTGATLNGSLTVMVVSPQTNQTSSSNSSLTFPLGLFLGVLAGAALAAVVVYAVGPRRRKERPPPPSPPTPYVTPGNAEWKED